MGQKCKVGDGGFTAASTESPAHRMWPRGTDRGRRKAGVNAPQGGWR